MRKVRLITYVEDRQELVSHGVCENTLKVEVLPTNPIASFNPSRDDEGYYILMEK